MNIERARRDVDSIFRHVLREVDPQRLVRNAISMDENAIVVDGVRHEVEPGGRGVLLGVGKSSIGMARGVEEALGARLDHGLVVTKRGLAADSRLLSRTEIIESSHPVPDHSSVDAGARLLAEANRLTTVDLAIVVVSGGGSALVESPVHGVTLEDFQATTDTLLRSGADIWTLNAVRRRLSRIKAGGLAQAIAPARLVNLILSDVLGNPLSVIASGLSLNVEEEDSERLDVIRESTVWHELPAAVRERLSQPTQARGMSTNVVQSVVVGDAALAARAAADGAATLGYRPFITGVQFAGEAREFARFWSEMALSVAHGDSDVTPPCCIIGAGEMTVTVRGDGKGGRNTEMAAAAALEIDDEPRVVIASLATDGDDGPSQSAGGVVDGQTAIRLRGRGLHPRELLDRNDTLRFLEESGGLIVTGQTGTNVNDLYLALVSEAQGVS